MDKTIELTEEQKQQAKEVIEDQMTKLGEIFSQCWESDKFRNAFKENPKAVFEEYGVNYNKDRNYEIIDTPEKTMIHVLPYKGVKQSIKGFNDMLLKHVEDIEDDDAKQVLLPGWSWQVYQNTEDTFYIPIPLCPENLTPEELELVNGGCLILVFVFLAEMEAAVTTSSFVTEVEMMLLLAASVAAVLDVVAAAAIAVGFLTVVAEEIVVLGTIEYAYTTTDKTGAWVFVHNAAIDETPSNSARAASQITGSVDPRRRGR